MSDRTNKTIHLRLWAILCVLAIPVTIPLGCTMHGEPADDKSTPPELPVPAHSGDAQKFQPPREVAAEDVEAFRNAVDQIGRLEYGLAEAEIRILLVRFESVDDPNYVSQALFWLGYCCEKQGVTDQARDYYQRLIEHYADTRPGKQAAQRLQRLPAE